MAQVEVTREYSNMQITIKVGVYDSADKRIAPNLDRLLELGCAIVTEDEMPNGDGLGFTPLEEEPVIRSFQAKKKK